MWCVRRVRAVPILANLPPSQVAAQATFSLCDSSIAKGMDELRPCLVEILKNLTSQHIHPERIQDLVHGVDVEALLDAVLHGEVVFVRR